MQKVLVLDAHQRSALAIIRSLGSHGLEIVAGDHVANPLGAASRYAAGSVRYPDPATSPRSFVREIGALAERLDIDIIVPVTDLTTMLLVNQPNLSKIARLAAPSAASYEAVTDKGRLIELAGRLGIPAPATRVTRSIAEIMDSTRDLGFPIVLKPARSRYFKEDRVVSTSVEIAKDQRELFAALGRLTWLADIPCLVQQFIPGHGAGIFALYASAKATAWFAHQRIREKPPTGGVSVLCESFPIDCVMQSFAEKLLSATAWTGVVMVEFRVAVDGSPYLMEVNGRFWGSLQLAIDCGIDFPWLLYQYMQGSPLAGPQPYVVGRRLRWLLGDIDSLLISLRKGDLSLGSRAGVLWRFLYSFLDPRCRQEVFRIRDPRPGLREVAHWLEAVRGSGEI
jgi:predicted ATP-grasp superfamily ATP-dependent carboligase